MDFEDTNAEPKFKSIVKDFQHFLNVRGDNHKFMEHLFMERLKVEAELLEKLETEIEQLKLLTLKSCPNCGMCRPKRYHRSTQTPRAKATTKIIIPGQGQVDMHPKIEADSIETRIHKLTEKMDKVSSKTNGMLQRSYQLQDNSKLLGYQVDSIRHNY